MKSKDFVLVPVDQWQKSVLFKYTTYILAATSVILAVFTLYALFLKQVIYINAYKEFGVAARAEITDDVVAMFAEKVVLTLRNVNERNIDEIFQPYTGETGKFQNTFFYRFAGPSFREDFYTTMMEWRRLVKEDGRADRFYNTDTSTVVRDKNLFKVTIKGIEEFYMGSVFLKSFRTEFLVTVRSTDRTEANPIGLEIVEFKVAKDKVKIFDAASKRE
jgi:hypothetical protein